MMQYKYKAFISYSRKDAKFADWLHKNLEKYHLPASLRIANPHLAKTLGKFFKDTEDLAAHSSLDDALKETLQNSEFLIVICSTASSKSHWVNEEIKYFKSIHGEDKVIPIIIDGEPNATTNPKFDNQYEAFPEALRFEVNSEGDVSKNKKNPIGGDIRDGNDSKYKALVRTISRILNVHFDDIWQRSQKRQKISRRLSIGAIIATICIITFSIYSLMKQEHLQVINNKLVRIADKKHQDLGVALMNEVAYSTQKDLEIAMENVEKGKRTLSSLSNPKLDWINKCIDKYSYVFSDEKESILNKYCLCIYLKSSAFRTMSIVQSRMQRRDEDNSIGTSINIINTCRKENQLKMF